MKLTFNQSLLKVRHTKIKYIIIHQTTCQYEIPDTKIDNGKFQISGLINNALEKKEPDLNFHFVIDKIKDDYQIIVCRPFVSLCDYDDIDTEINRSALHIGLMGNYDFKIPDQRLYEVLCYRLLNPLMKQFIINPNFIHTHEEISKNKDLSCPGTFINKEKIISMIRRFVVK